MADVDSQRVLFAVVIVCKSVKNPLVTLSSFCCCVFKRVNKQARLTLLVNWVRIKVRGYLFQLCYRPISVDCAWNKCQPVDFMCIHLMGLSTGPFAFWLVRFLTLEMLHLILNTIMDLLLVKYRHNLTYPNLSGLRIFYMLFAGFRWSRVQNSLY